MTLRFFRFIYVRWIHLVDNATFWLVNLSQRRHRAHATTLEELQVYHDQIKGCSLQEFYAASPLALAWDPAQPRPQRWTYASPHPCDMAENNLGVLDFFPCAATWERPVMFLLHGLMSASDAGYRRWARKINERGWHAVFLHLPYHYARRPRGYLSGELASGPDGLRTVEGVRQAVKEVRSLMRTLERLGCPGCGVWGMSYGGWVAALVAALEPALRCALLLEPIVDLAHAVWHSPASHTVRDSIHANGLTQEDSARLDRWISPAALRPACVPDRVAVLAGEYDLVAPPELLAHFAQSWGTSRYYCYRQGHVGYQLMRGAFQEWSEHFASG